MKNSAALALGFASLALANVCNNNCGRAVTGTARKDPSLEARSSMCSEFLTSTTTVTPSTTTVTAAPIYQRNVHDPRGAEAPVLTAEKPAYAGNCADITAYWNACQCFGITPTLVTETAPTPTETLTGPTCTQGLEFALYAPVAGSPAWENLDYARVHGVNHLDLPLLLGGKTPDATGVTPSIARINGDENAPISVYGVTGPDGTTLAKSIIDHRGFISPQSEGTYVVRVHDADDAVFVWVGETAVSGFGLGNANILKGYADGPDKLYEIEVSAAQIGEAVAIRLLWVNWAGRGVVDAKVRDPAGKVILGFDTEKNQQVLASCEGDFALVPEWVSWEEEVIGSTIVV